MMAAVVTRAMAGEVICLTTQADYSTIGCRMQHSHGRTG
jgi:hypothetical protein